MHGDLGRKPLIPGWRACFSGSLHKAGIIWGRKNLPSAVQVEADLGQGSPPLGRASLGWGQRGEALSDHWISGTRSGAGASGL